MRTNGRRIRIGTVLLAVSILVATAGVTGVALAGASAPAAPGVPTHVATVIGKTTVKLTWRKGTASATNPVTSYVVTAKPKTKSYTVKASSAAQYSVTVTGLKPSTKYTFAVHAVSKVGTSKPVALAVTMGPTGTIKWELSSDLPTGVIFNDTYLDAAGTGIATATNNQVQVTEYPANTLYSSQTLAVTALEQGQIQAVVTQALDVNSLLPAFDGTQIAYIAPTSPQYFKIFAPGTPWFTEAAAECAKAGIELVPVAAGSPGEAGFGFTSTTPVTNSVGSLNGLKVRIAGSGIVGNEIQALGGQTVNLSTTQVAVAMQSGTVQAALGSAAFDSTTLKGIIHGYLDAGTFQYGPYFMFVNMKDWQALGTKLQNEIIGAVDGPINNYLATINEQQEVSDQTLASQGDWVVKSTPAQVTQYAQQLQPTALAGFAKEDPASYKALITTVKEQGIKLYTSS